MGWIPLTEFAVWFGLSGYPESCRSWLYRGIYAIETGYLGAKQELNGD